jgi:predicted anti-sigma-YlaC factor YlaD
MTMLNCREITERTSDFLDATLPWRVRLQLRLHLMMCRFCREYVRQMALLTRTLRRLPPQEPSDELPNELLAQFRASRKVAAVLRH